MLQQHLKTRMTFHNQSCHKMTMLSTLLKNRFIYKHNHYKWYSSHHKWRNVLVVTLSLLQLKGKNLLIWFLWCIGIDLDLRLTNHGGRAERKSRAYFHIHNMGYFGRFKELRRLKPEDIYMTNQVYGQLTKQHVTYLDKLHLWDHIQWNQGQINKVFLLCLWGCVSGKFKCRS